MKIQGIWVLTLVSILGACGDSGPADLPSDPPDDPPPPPAPTLAALELTLPAVVEDSLGTVVPVVVTGRDSEGEPMEPPPGTRLQILTSTPYFEGSVVARPTGSFPELGLELAWPGRVLLRAITGSVVSPEVAVDVAPRHPVVERLAEARVAAGGEGTLIGYRMDLLDAAALRAGGGPLEVLAREPSSITFRVPDLGVPTEGCNPDSRVPLELTGVRLYGAPPVLQYGQGRPVSLAPGEYEFLGSAAATCLSFAGGEVAEYTLVYADGRPIRESETVPEGTSRDWFFASLQLEIADRSVAQTASSLRVGAEPLTPPGEALQRHMGQDGHLRELATPEPSSTTTVPDSYIGFINRPLRPGEQVHVQEVQGTEVVYPPARVLKLYGDAGQVVLLGLESDGASEELAGGSWRVDPELEALARDLHVISTAFSDNFPSGYATGQAVFLVQSKRDGFPAGATIANGGTRPNTAPNGYVVVSGYDPEARWTGVGPVSPLSTLAHEAAHLAQFSRKQDLCDLDPENACGWGGETWALEGGAEFVGHEVVRRDEGFDFTENFRPALRVIRTFAGLGRWAGPPTYPFSTGYGYAEWFMHDLMERLVREGYPVDDALAVVGRATLEPWYGWVGSKFFDPVDNTVKNGPPRKVTPGLVPRMREVLGAEWDPVEGFLLAAASQAVDDRNPNPDLQNMTLGHAYELYEGPMAEIRLGSGESLDFETRAWTWGWADVEAPPEGGDLSFGSPEPNVYWMLVRRR